MLQVPPISGSRPEHNGLLPPGFDAGALITQGWAGSPNHSEFSKNLVTIINCESLKEISEMARVMPSRFTCGQT